MTIQAYGGWYAQSLAIDYLLGGHELLYPTGKRDGDAHLDARLRMFQTSRPIGRAQMEARIFYTRSSLGMKLDVKRAIRRLVWSGREVTKPFHLLPARIETYRVTPTVGKAVDAAAKAFEKSLARLKFDMHIHAEFGTDVQADWTARLRRLKRLNRHIYADAFPASIALRFGAGSVPPAIDHA